MVAAQAKNTPHAKKADDQLHDGGGRLLDGLHKGAVLRQQDQVRHIARQDEECVGREADKEEIEEAVVALAHAVAHPGTVVVELLHAVVADGAVGGAGRPVELAREAVLEFGIVKFHINSESVNSKNKINNF